jgi:hypothetical protein
MPTHLVEFIIDELVEQHLPPVDPPPSPQAKGKGGKVNRLTAFANRRSLEPFLASHRNRFVREAMSKGSSTFGPVKGE